MAVSAQMRAQVSQLYVAMFGRAPDGEGLGFWVQQLSNGQSLTSVADTMFAVSAARAYYPSFMTNSEMVTSFYTKVLGRTPDAEGLAFWTAKLNATGATPGSVINQLITAVTTYAGTDAAGVASKALFMNKADVAQTYGESNGTIAGATTILGGVTSDATTVTTAKAVVTAGSNSAVISTLTTGVDNLTGTSSDDTFKATIQNNANTLQSGDVISGGAGNDSLKADIGNSQAFAISAETSGIETVAIRAQAVAADSNNNNMADPGTYSNQVQIDAQRMQGVTQWESNNSRADVVIEDVRILPTQITKDITIAMVETDPGHVDFGVYFDQYSLRAQTNTTATLSLQLMDTRSAAAGTGPLKDNPYSGFSFYLTATGSTTPKLITVKSQAIDDALTYADLLTAVKAAVAAVPDLAGFTVTLGSDFIVNDTLGTVLTGKSIVLTGTDVGTIATTGTGVGWIATGVVPGSSGLHTKMDPVLDPTVQLVTSKIILDDVGRGSTAGDLVVGGLSVGDTSTSKGVQSFEIEVRDNSKLETINSTNNTLQKVTIKSGATTSGNFAYETTDSNAGNLTVNGVSGANGANVTNVGLTDAFRAAILAKSGFFGNVGNAGSVDAQSSQNTPLPGSAAQTVNGYGFSDVKEIDATEFKGKLSFSAEVTTASVAKYLNPTDIKALPANDNIAFTYTGGLNHDTMFIQLDSTAVASRNTIIAGREDFTFTANGGAGNDTITLRTVASGLTGFLAATPTLNEAWYINQKLNANVSVNGGDGNDTIWTPGAGDVKIDGGAGNDTVYADNTGALSSATATVTGVTVTAGVPAGVAGPVTAAQAATAVTVATANLAAAKAVAVPVPADIAAAELTLTTATAAQTAATAQANLINANPKAVFVFNTANQMVGAGYTVGANVLATDLARKVDDLKSDSNQSYNLYKTKLTVTFKGLASAAIVVGSDATTYKTGDLNINQAIKEAINADPVLMKLLVATDGPANSLVVTSLIDGAMTAADLTVAIAAPGNADFSVTELGLLNSAWGTNYADSAALAAAVAITLAAGATQDGLFNAAVVGNGDYVTQLADTGVAGGLLMTGAASVSVSDHTITGGADTDVIVLSTTVNAGAIDTLTSSNDIVKFSGTAFGNDTIVNFAIAGNGIDTLDFSALGGVVGGAVGQFNVVGSVNKSIIVAAEVAANNGTAALVVTNGGFGDSVTAQTHVYIAVDDKNVGKVYAVTDAAGVAAGSVTAQMVGTIDLADIGWAGLTAANFA